MPFSEIIQRVIELARHDNNDLHAFLQQLLDTELKMLCTLMYSGRENLKPAGIMNLYDNLHPKLALDQMPSKGLFFRL